MPGGLNRNTVGGSVPDGIYELLAGNALFEELRDPCLGSRCALACFVMYGQADYRFRELAAGDFRDRIIAIAAAHLKINQNNIGVQAFRQFHGFAFVGGFTDYANVRVHFKDSTEAGAEGCMVAG